LINAQMRLKYLRGSQGCILGYGSVFPWITRSWVVIYCLPCPNRPGFETG